MKELPIRKLHRLKEYDYSQDGYYFITICTKDRKMILSNVGNAVPGVPPKVELTEVGRMVKDSWEKISQIDESIKTDVFCIMPNHIHGIIVIENKDFFAERRGRRSLHSLVSGFKSVTTRRYNKITNNCESLWQSSFYDTVIRDESQLYEIRKYITYNHIKWNQDKYFEKEENVWQNR